MIETPRITFLTCCDEKYLHFVEPFIHFANKSNPGSIFEIFVPQPKLMKKEENVYFHQLPPGNPATLRFILEPQLNKTNYTYITDIDILITETVSFFHINHMKDRSFSNVVREKKGETERLTGLHFVKNDPWYRDTKVARELSNPYEHDETVLYQIVKSVYPDVNLDRGLSNRPVHGIHCSHNRKKIFGIPGWEIDSQRLSYFQETIKSSPRFSDKFIQLVQPLINHKTV